MEIKKKAWRALFTDVLDGKKNFDVRLDDEEWKDVKEGDVLILQEWDEQKKGYTGREIRKVIGYSLKTRDLPFWSEIDVSDKGLVVFGLKDSEE